MLRSSAGLRLSSNSFKRAPGNESAHLISFSVLVLCMLDSSLWKKLKRGPQVVLLKDAAFASAFTGLQGGDRVVDAGSGSGWLAIYLGSIVAPSGRVYSYEWRGDFAELAEKNVAKAGLQEIVEIKRKDVFQGIDEREVDLVCLDLANAEKTLPHAFAALKPKGSCVGFLPNVEQVKAFVLEAQRLGFEHERTVSVLPIEWLVRQQGARPATKGLLHTVFLAFLRSPARNKFF